MRRLPNLASSRQSADFFAQYGQDAFLSRFVDTRNGKFIDVGAFDGETNSNTAFFERKRGWRGVLVEPNPDAFKLLQERRESVAINVAITPEPSNRKFLVVEGYAAQLSGMSKNSSLLTRLRRSQQVYKSRGAIKEVEVPSSSLQAIIDKFSLHDVDLLSIDVEGSESDVVATIDFSRFHARIVLIENNYGERKALRQLTEAGYSPLCRLGSDVMLIGPEKGVTVP